MENADESGIALTEIAKYKWEDSSEAPDIRSRLKGLLRRAIEVGSRLQKNIDKILKRRLHPCINFFFILTKKIQESGVINKTIWLQII